MKYESLYDIVYSQGHQFDESDRVMLECDRTLGGVMSSIKKELKSGDIGRYAANIALNAPRIIRGVVNYKNAHPDASQIEELTRDAIALGLDIYMNKEESEERIGELRKKITYSGNEAMLKIKLRQMFDIVTWKASHPIKSMRSALSLIQSLDGDDMLFIALGNGGVGPGMDVYLRYCDLSESDNSEFYVARFSRSKEKKFRDAFPRLIVKEKEYLKEQSEGRKVVVFDEDSYTGDTLKIAKVFFEEMLFDDEVITLINKDERECVRNNKKRSGLDKAFQTFQV